MLLGIDDIAWDRLEHAYGSAEDVPDLVRAAASADADASDEAISELYGSVVHQGSVYSSTPVVLPFLFEIIANPQAHHRGLLVGLIGTAAEGDYDGSILAVLDPRLDELLELLGDQDEQVRAMAAFTLGQMRGVPLQRMRWDIETSPHVRTLILMAVCRQDITQAAEWITAALREEGPVQVAAAYAVAVHGLPWSAAATEAVVSGCAGGDPLAGWEWDPSWLSTVVCSVDAGVVPGLLSALARSENSEVRLACLYAAIDAMNGRRSLPQVLVPVLAPLLADPDIGVVRGAVSGIQMSGYAAQAADELAALTARQLDLESPHSTDPRSAALRVLVEIGDPRWRGPVLAGHISDKVVTAMVDAAVPVDDELLAAARAALRDDPSHNARIALVQLVGSWGNAARAALPEVLAALDQADRVAPDALIAIAPDAPQVREALAQATGNVRAAKVLHELTGDPEPLLAAVEANFNDHTAIAMLADAGEAARRLLPRLTTMLRDDEATIPVRRARVAAAKVYWRLTGDVAAVLPTVAAVLRDGDISAVEAAELAGELRDDSLVPLLRNLLADEWATVAAAQALWRITGQAEVEPVLRVLRHGWPWPSKAVTALVEMRATDAIDTLRDLAERDQRVVSSGIESSIIRDDEALRAQIREAIAALS